jgi:hypothetical protein
MQESRARACMREQSSLHRDETDHIHTEVVLSNCSNVQNKNLCPGWRGSNDVNGIAFFSAYYS